MLTDGTRDQQPLIYTSTNNENIYIYTEQSVGLANIFIVRRPGPAPSYLCCYPACARPRSVWGIIKLYSVIMINRHLILAMGLW